MDGKFILPFDVFFIQAVFDKPFNLDGDRLVHFVTHYRPDQLSFHSTFFHSKNFSVSWGLVIGFPDDGLNPGNIDFRLFDLVRIFDLSDFKLKTQVEQLLFQVGQLLQPFLRIHLPNFAGFHA
jgi:hypothetical protein